LEFKGKGKSFFYYLFVFFTKSIYICSIQFKRQKMAKITFEQPFASDSEAKLAESIKALLDNASFANKYGEPDCRKAAPAIRTLVGSFDLNMIVGCGGSHIWIHRSNEFKMGQHTSMENKRWAIVTEH